MRLRSSVHLLPVLPILLAAAGASAQILDYRGLEGLFGEPVTSSATGMPERLSDTPATMDVITAEQIKRSGARDLASLLRTLPGVISYRGFNGTESFSMGALLLNGREIYNASFNQTLLDNLPIALEEIRQIEVIRGPLSALYGFNAGEGVINIITFDPSQDPINMVMARAGNDGRRDGTVIATLPLWSGVGLRLSAGGDHAHDVGDVQLTTPQAPLKNPERQALSAQLSAMLPNGDRAGAEISHSDQTVRTMVPEVTEFLDLRVQTDAVKADYTADTVIGLASAMVSYTALTLPAAYTPVNSLFSIHDHTIDAKATDLVKIGPADSLRFEIEVRNEEIHTSTSIAPIESRLVGGSTMWEHQFLPGLRLVNVVRYVRSETIQGDSGTPATYVDFENHGLSDNSALIYRLTDDDSLRLSFARGIALPSQLTFEQFGVAAAPGKKTSLANNPNATTADLTEYRVSWDHQVDLLAATGRASLFNKQSDDVLGLLPLQFEAALLPTCVRPTPRTAPTCALMARESGLEGVIQGVELQLDHASWKGVEWGLSYSYQQDHPHPTADAAALVPSLNGAQSYHKVTANLGYVAGDWTFDARLLYSSAVRSLVLTTAPVPQVGLVSDKQVVSLSPHVSWTPISDLTLDLAADNLWGYKADLLQRVPTTYFMTVKWSY
jgi:outer membrane receptor for ferrienterochelin and colicins